MNRNFVDELNNEEAAANLQQPVQWSIGRLTYVEFTPEITLEPELLLARFLFLFLSSCRCFWCLIALRYIKRELIDLHF